MGFFGGGGGAAVDLASPSAIGNTTPNTGAFTTLSFAPPANTSGLTSTGYSLTGSNAQSLVNLAGTWNTTGAANGVRINITDTASQNNHATFFDVQRSGTSIFRIIRNTGVSQNCFFDVAGNWIANRSGSFWVAGSGGGGFNGLEASAYVGLHNGFGAYGGSSPSFTSADTFLRREAANIFGQYNGTNAQEYRFYGTFTSTTNYQRMTIKSVKQTLSALSGASQTTTGTFIPDGAVVVGVTTRVATLLTGATGYTIGDGTDADRWGDITGTAVGTTSDNRDWTAGTIECFTAGGNITLTAKTSNFTAGAIEICVFYLAGEAD